MNKIKNKIGKFHKISASHVGFGDVASTVLLVIIVS